MQAIMGIMQMLLLPLSFLSGALYPLRDLPTWLATLVKLNPLTYAVHAVRTTVFAHLDAPRAALEQLNPPITWWGWAVPLGVQIGLVAVLGVLLLVASIAQFNRAQ
jgi:ABC-2 type transport system permease protein